MKPEVTVAEIKTMVETEYVISGIQTVMAAINEEFAADDDRVKAGDTVAFIPSVSGG
jgi:molybdopterin synthase sulfur carrier subunit